MAVYVTREELRSYATDLSITEQASLRKSIHSRALAGSTFLSHSSKDKDVVIGASRVLEGHGGRVYVDEVDPDMPPYTNEQTAVLLKMRIAQAKRFVLLEPVGALGIGHRRWREGLRPHCAPASSR